MIQTFEYRPTEADLIDGFALMGRRKRARRVFPLALAALAVCVVLLTLLIGSFERLFASPLLTALSAIAAFLALVLVILLASIPTLRRRAARATLTSNPNFEGPITVCFDDETFQHRTEYVSARYPWEKLHGWRDSGRVVTIHPAPNLFYLVPCAALDGAALAALRTNLARSRRGRLDA